MSHLIPGECDVTLNEVQIHYTVRGSGPVMIAHSRELGMDARTWYDFAKADEIAKHIPHARLEIFEDSGHYALVEEPEKSYRMIKEFVES